MYYLMYIRNQKYINQSRYGHDPKVRTNCQFYECSWYGRTCIPVDGRNIT